MNRGSWTGGTSPGLTAAPVSSGAVPVGDGVADAGLTVADAAGLMGTAEPLAAPGAAAGVACTAGNQAKRRNRDE